MNKILFTTSWDDGSVLDLRVADLLSRYGIKGTFYVPEKFAGRTGKYSAYNRRLTEDEIRSLAVSHEVGGHSLTHSRLTEISLEEAKSEITGSQEFLQKITGSPAKIFAFPGGKSNEFLTKVVRESGFTAVRTTKKLSIQKAKEKKFLMDVTIICQPFPLRWLDSNNLYWRRILDPMRAYTPKQWSLSWQSLARKWFKKALAEGNYFHLYGHSWELEKYGMWSELESFLKFVREHQNIVCLSNSEVLEWE